MNRRKAITVTATSLAAAVLPSVAPPLNAAPPAPGDTRRRLHIAAAFLTIANKSYRTDIFGSSTQAQLGSVSRLAKLDGPVFDGVRKYLKGLTPADKTALENALDLVRKQMYYASAMVQAGTYSSPDNCPCAYNTDPCDVVDYMTAAPK
jgi:hypothetical protein